MKYEVTYTVKGFLNPFKDVVEVSNVDECEKEIKKLVEKYTGQKKSVSVILIKSV